VRGGGLVDEVAHRLDHPVPVLLGAIIDRRPVLPVLRAPGGDIAYFPVIEHEVVERHVAVHVELKIDFVAAPDQRDVGRDDEVVDELAAAVALRNRQLPGMRQAAVVELRRSGVERPHAREIRDTRVLLEGGCAQYQGGRGAITRLAVRHPVLGFGGTDVFVLEVLQREALDREAVDVHRTVGGPEAILVRPGPVGREMEAELDGSRGSDVEVTVDGNRVIIGGGGELRPSIRAGAIERVLREREVVARLGLRANDQVDVENSVTGNRDAVLGGERLVPAVSVAGKRRVVAQRAGGLRACAAPHGLRSHEREHVRLQADIVIHVEEHTGLRRVVHAGPAHVVTGAAHIEGGGVEKRGGGRRAGEQRAGIHHPGC
jgi:hypothetical protein